MTRTLVLIIFLCNIWLQNSFAQFMYLSKTDPAISMYEVDEIPKITFNGNKMNLVLSDDFTDIETINNIHKITFSYISGVGIADISTGDKTQLRTYPNPANEKVIIEYSLNVPGNVEFTIYNMSGILVDYFNRDFLQAGNYSYTWSLTDMTKNRVGNGIYMCQIRTADKILTGKIIIIK